MSADETDWAAPAAAARDLATESCIGGVVPGIGSRSPRNP
jgi:hypothetical protein